MPRKWIKVLIWTALSLSMLGVAAFLTVMITAVNGKALLNVQGNAVTPDIPQLTLTNDVESNQKQLLNVVQAIKAAQKKDPTDAQPKRQSVAIYTRQSTDDINAKIDIGYFSGHDGKNANINVDFPAGAEARILLTNLVDEKSCTSTRNPPFARPDSMYNGGRLPLTIHKYSRDNETNYFVVDPGAPDSAFSVFCQLSIVAEAHTYTEWSATFDFGIVSDLGFLYPGLDNALKGFMPLPKEVLSFRGIDGADQFWFYGGYQDQNLSSFESGRVLEPGQSVYFTWLDVNREQLRDLILVIIGTLIAIGVTMGIEALRHIIDDPEPMVAKPKRSPTHKL